MVRQGEGVAEKEVGRGRSSRGLMIARSFRSIVWSLAVAGSSGLRALFAHVHLQSSQTVSSERGSWGQRPLIGRGRQCTTPVPFPAME